MIDSVSKCGRKNDPEEEEACIGEVDIFSGRQTSLKNNLVEVDNDRVEDKDQRSSYQKGFLKRGSIRSESNEETSKGSVGPMLWGGL